MDEDARKLIEEMNRLSLLMFTKCRTDRQLTAHRNLQQAVTDIENELKKAPSDGNGS